MQIDIPNELESAVEQESAGGRCATFEDVLARQFVRPAASKV